MPVQPTATTPADTATGNKLISLRAIIRDCESLIVAYSGGVDSAFLMSVAHDVLGKRAIAITARSPSLPASELAAATELAARFGWTHRVIDTREVDDPRYAANNTRRCYFCKTELYTWIEQIRAAEGWKVIANGTNQDDLGDFRPGLDAAREHAIRSPLLEAELTKADVRALARQAGLPVWDKPAQACLSSRVPYGTHVTVQMLRKIETAEAALHVRGFRSLRVRHHGTVARIEVPLEELPRLIDPEVRQAIVAAVREAGYLYVTVDLAGLRSGSMNEAIAGWRGNTGTA
ncbi:MAG: ATP-dependent sacrificial sulfur transferase LarE [Chloroflexi bacterium]|nr:ATP-dependent sacrificial sulfur transferase LarE [Chloroflexota bacterium]